MKTITIRDDYEPSSRESDLAPGYGGFEGYLHPSELVYNWFRAIATLSWRGESLDFVRSSQVCVCVAVRDGITIASPEQGDDHGAGSLHSNQVNPDEDFEQSFSACADSAVT